MDRCENVKCEFYATCQLVDDYDDVTAIGDVIEFDGDGVDDGNVKCVCPAGCLDEVFNL
jgi:hypothetical protein